MKHFESWKRIAIALLLEWKRRLGLGVGGAIAIDLCAATVLAAWLLVGGVDLPFRGQFLLWSIVALLVFVSGLGLASHSKP